MKKKVIAFMMAVAFLCNPWAHPVHDSVADQVAVSAAVTNTVPEGYTPIYTIDDLYAVRNNLSGKYILMNDIDLSATAPGGDWDSGNGWKPIGGAGESSFSGVFDGNGYAIKNMHIYGNLNSNERYVGLFGDCTNAKITKLALVNCDINIEISTKDYIFYIGSVSAHNSYVINSGTTINEVYTSGEINVKINDNDNAQSTCYISGISNVHRMGIENAFNNCNIYVNYNDNSLSYDIVYVGGIGIEGYGGINCTYNTGKITIIKDEESTSYFAVGSIGGSIGNRTTNSYYLRTQDGYTASADMDDNMYKNVAGLSAGQMKSSAAFVGFDFDNVWTIDPTAAYPYPTLKNVPYVSAGSSAQPSTQPSTQPTTNPPSGSSLKGDINGDGVVNAKDATIILIYAAKTGTGQNVSIDDLY